MYPLINGNRKFILYWNARCACTSLKNWFYFVDRDTYSHVALINGNGVSLPSNRVHMVVPYIEIPFKISNDENLKDYVSILVTRNPVDRLVSVLNHSVLEVLGVTNLNKHKIERMEDLLRFLEERDMDSNIEHHLNLQCLFPDNHNCHKGPIRDRFNHILRIEDGPVIPRINQILGTNVPDFRENISDKDSYVPFPEQVERIKKLYAWDYFHFYPDDDGIINNSYYKFYPYEQPSEYIPKFGDCNTDIIIMQNRMIHLGMNVSCTGVYDEQTRAAIIQWQSDNGMDITGELDDKTKKYIRGL
jgi:hypothetical protein